METQLTDTVNTHDTVLDILEAARARQCGTVVVGRESLHGLAVVPTLLSLHLLHTTRPAALCT